MQNGCVASPASRGTDPPPKPARSQTPTHAPFPSADPESKFLPDGLPDKTDWNRQGFTWEPFMKTMWNLYRQRLDEAVKSNEVPIR